MSLYDPKCVRFDYTPEVYQKKVLAADSIGAIKSAFDGCFNDAVEEGVVTGYGNKDFPFLLRDGHAYVFAYIDPLIDFKWGYLQGKVIETRQSPEGEWTEVTDDHVWTNTNEYRFGESRLITKRQLTEWLAKGNGEYCFPKTKTS